MENLRQFLLPYTSSNKQPLVHATMAENSLPHNSILILNNPAIHRLVARTNYVACQQRNYPHDMDNCLVFNNVSSIKFDYVSNYADLMMIDKLKGATGGLKIFKEVSGYTCVC